MYEQLFRIVKPRGKSQKVKVRIEIDVEGIINYLTDKAANAQPLDRRRKESRQQARLARGLAVATVLNEIKQEV